MKPGQELRKYQQQAAAVTLMRNSLLLGDDVGLGKTYTAAGFMLSKLARPAAAVMQTHLQDQWAEKIEAFTHLKTHRIKGTRPYSLPPADVYLFKYSQLAGWVDFFPTKFFRSCSFDEIQELRTGSASLKGSAAKVLAEHADYQLGLSATPIYNYGGELWNIYRVLDDSVLGTREEFSREWCSQGDVIKDPKALGTFLREQHVFLRRTKADVGQQMPAVNVIVEAVDSDDEMLASVESLARALAIRTTTGTFEERGRASRELDLLVRHATGVAKAKGVAQYVGLFMETGTPIVLAGWHRDVYEIWNRELAEFNPVMYTGTESPAQKQASVRAFLEGQTNLFIISLRSGAGLDGLQGHCSTVVFGELDWSPKIHEQVIGRLDREGQKEAITAIFLNAADGSDPPMVDLLGLKNAQATAVIDPNAPIQSKHSDMSRIQALAQQYLSKKHAAVPAVAEPEETAVV